MVKMFPYTFKPFKKRILFSNDAGDFFLSSLAFLERLVTNALHQQDIEFLLRKGFACTHEYDFYFNSHIYRLKERKKTADNISYIIAIPTLRCDLNCNYCQVSRANADAKGFDWTPEILESFKKFLSELPPKKIKIEFQGGEPTLRLDIIEEIIKYTKQQEIDTDFILCTNLSQLTPQLRKIIKLDNVYISTSIDGPNKTHTANRTQDENLSNATIENYKKIQIDYGPNKINALPTIAARSYEQIQEIIDFYVDLGQTTIFLRPVNHQGFARKNYSELKQNYDEWLSNYRKALEYIFQVNFENKKQIIEVGLEIALKRALLPSYNGHVDLRTPNPAIKDYLVVNYDGDIYPSDEARMLSRIRHVDLRMGNIISGLNKSFVTDYNWNQMNEIHPDCIHCAYKPFCGIDTIDDLSRNNRTDLPKHMTYFCNSNTSTFDFIFQKIEQNDPVALFNFQGHLSRNFSNEPLSSGWIYD